MRRILSILFLLYSLQSLAQKPAEPAVTIRPFDSKFQFVHTATGQPVDNLLWDEAEPFVNGFSRVLKDTAFSFINMQGKLISPEVFENARNFSNKIWNASRFVAFYLDKNIKGTKRANKDFDKKLSEVVKNVTLNLEKLRVGQAAAVLQNEFWHWFCDKALEQTKKGEISALKIEQGLETFLKLLHPFMPFITEAIWQDILNKRGLLIKESWPK